MPNHDYSDNGWYFVTICTKNKEDNLGNVISCNNHHFIELSDIGEIANKYWLEIPNHFSFVLLDEYVIMPNHIHGIINIRRRLIYQMPTDNAIPVNLINQTNLINQIPTTDMENKKNNPMEMKKNSLGKIIRYFKGLSTYNIRHIHPGFMWQPRFHDRVIRNQGELNRIRNYIINNPSAWHRDRNFLEKFNKNKTPFKRG